MAALAKNNRTHSLPLPFVFQRSWFVLLPHENLTAEVFLRVLPNAPITIQESKDESPFQEDEEKVLVDLL